MTAVCLDLDTEGFTYQKWGGMQRCKKGDWIVNNKSDVYTINAESFQRTDHIVSSGLYERIGAIWAEMASDPGSIWTKEGSTAYFKGDYLVSNDLGRKDGWVLNPATFLELYKPEKRSPVNIGIRGLRPDAGLAN